MTTALTDIDHGSHHDGATIIDCRGACIWAHTDIGLTLVAISGEIDALNVDDVSGHVRGLVPEGGALIVDLTDIDFIAVDGLRALFALSSRCVRTHTTWAMIATDAANRLLRVGDHDKLLPVVGSATEALLLVRRSARGRRSLQLASPAS
jgi:anti-anti-sigma factor